MQYFTGSKNHNVTLRQRALKMGFTLNEYGLFRLDNNKRVAGATEDEIYGKLKLDMHSSRAARELRRDRSGCRSTSCPA